MYVSELARPSMRGQLVAVNELATALGVLLAFLAGLSLQEKHDGWRWMFGLAAIPAVLQFASCAIFPESPKYLSNTGALNEAEAVLYDCRVRRFWLSTRVLVLDDEGLLNRSKLAPEVYAEIQTLRADAKATASTPNEKRQGGSEDDAGATRLLSVGIGLTLCQQLTGQPTLMYYAVSVFRSAGVTNPTQAAFATVLLGVFKMAGTSFAIMRIDKWGRRYFLLAGQIGMLIGLFLLIAGFFLQDVAKIQSPLVGALAIFGLTLFFASYSTGYGPTTWVILSELFPVAQRGRAMSTAVAVNWGSNLLISITFLTLVNTIGSLLSFVLYFVIGIGALVFCFYFVPETLGVAPDDLRRRANEGWLIARVKEEGASESVTVAPLHVAALGEDGGFIRFDNCADNSNN